MAEQEPLLRSPIKLLTGTEFRVTVFMRIPASISAKTILKQCGVGYDADPFSLVKVENDYPIKRAHRASLELLLEVLKTELKEPTDRASECYKDIYSVIRTYYDEHRISVITRKISNGKGLECIDELLDIKSHYQEVYDYYKLLWAKYR